MSRLLLVGGALAGAYFARKLVRNKPAPDTRDAGVFASSSQALSDLTAAAGEALPVGGGRAQIVDRGAAKYILGNLVSSNRGTVHHTQHLNSLAGTWIKDKAASSSMDAALDLTEIHGLLRKAICLMKGCEITFDNGDFVFAVTSVIPWFKVVERYPMTGESQQWRRRDLRKGKHTGYVEQQGSKLCVHLDWDHPFAGHGRDRMSSPSANTLIVESDCVIGGQAVAYRSVYCRA